MRTQVVVAVVLGMVTLQEAVLRDTGVVVEHMYMQGVVVEV